MRVSIEWLREYVDFDVEPEELAERLSMSGTSVDRILYLGKGVSGVIVGRVIEVDPHPAADNLRVALVEDGSMVREVVCGAPNLEVGMKTALALPGARLPIVSDKELRRATIRGVQSDGMLCSGAELGVSEDQSGIIRLDEDTPVGSELHEVLPLEDVIFDLEITPNRPDCMSMVGIAREVAALLDATLRMPEPEAVETGPGIDSLVSIEIKDTDECPRYTARAVSNVTIAASPAWMQRRLLAGGMRPINNVVDITNYVLLELGQPLHAFDLERLGERTIIVRLARYGEQIMTLDGLERQLDNQSLVIADISRPVALAGIMGGEDSEVFDTTTEVLIESAFFDPTSILQTSKRLGLRSEASARFERGTDPDGTSRAALRSAELMVRFAGGRMAAGEIDVYPVKIHPVGIEMRPTRANRVLGTEISKAEMIEILEKLEAGVADGDVLEVTVPTFRRDLEREIDLVEEIARIHGYAKIPEHVPAGGGLNSGLRPRQMLERMVTDTLVAQGLLQCVVYSFMRPGDLDLLGVDAEDRLRKTVSVMNPLAETGEVMRTTVIPGLLRVTAGNLNRGNRDLALFESGHVFISRGSGELPDEFTSTGILLCGQWGVPGWSESSRPADFFDLKGVIENLAESLFVRDLAFENADVPFLAPGRSSRIILGGVEAGIMGQLHPRVAGALDVEGDIFLAEFATDAIINAAGAPDYSTVGRFPSVKVDIALILDEAVQQRSVEDAIWREGGEFLQSVRLFDVYRGPQTGDRRKSLAYALEFGSPGRTLTDDEAHAELDRVVNALEREFQAKLRSREDESGGGV